MEKSFKRRIFLSFLLLVMCLSSLGNHITVDAASKLVNEVELYAEQLGGKLADEAKPQGFQLKIKPGQYQDQVRVMVEFKTQPIQVVGSHVGLASLSQIQAEQKTFTNQLVSSGMDYDLGYSFQKLFNGLSLTVAPEDIARIEAMPSVKSVVPAMIFERPKPLMKDSVGKVAAPYAWNLGYKGEGMVVAVIDSGFDPSHPDFKLTDPKLAKLTPTKVAAKGLKGFYINSKFPYGWNYYDRTKKLYQAGTSHGQHVAGSVAANGQIKGIAPEAQLLAMRVFSDDETITTTSEDIYLKAMEDAIVLGADALNLSFGAPVGFVYNYERPIQKAIANANALGAVVAIAAGNDRNLAFGAESLAASWMPDQGLINEPAVQTQSLAVAAADTVSGVPSMAWFSSWGSTNDLGMKPEITAPGTLIKSTQNEGGYDWMSGTSMATPQVSGGVALVKQYIVKTKVYNPEAKKNLPLLAKTVLMNSAQLIYENGIAVSPRQQGAGMMNLENALNARSLAVAKTSGEAKIELKELTQPNFNVKIVTTNHGSLVRDYTISAILLTDQIDGTGHYTETSRNVAFSMTGNEPFRLAGEASQEISLTLDFSQGKVAKNQFIEGFIIIKDQNGAKTSLPFMGFYGDWGKPEILDRFMESDGSGLDPMGKSFFNTSGLLGYALDPDDFYQLPTKRLELNPGTPISQKTGKGTVYPVLSSLRSLENLEFSILSEDGKLLKLLGSSYEIFKTNRIYDGEPTAFYYDAGMWDGMVDSKPIPQGRYVYEMKGWLNTKKFQSQTKRIPILIDYTGPSLTDLLLEGTKLSVTAWDGLPENAVGLSEVIVSSGISGKPIEIKLTSGDGLKFSGDISKIINSGAKQIYVFAYDRLYNSTSRVVLLKDLQDKVTRLTGPNRYQTAIAISKYSVNQAKTVIIASGVASADSLVAGPLSAQLNAPLLLVNSRTLSKEVISEIKRLHSDSAIIVGGEAVVPKVIADELKKLGLSVERLSGVNRYETSIKVDKKVRALSGVTSQAVIASGKSLVDALAMGPVAAKMGVGILFNDGQSIIKIKDALKGKTQITLLGGLKVQSAEVESSLRALGMKVERVYGATRRETALAVAKRFYSEPMTIVFANDRIPYDALAGANLSYSLKAPILLTRENNLGVAERDYVASKHVKSIILLGGQARISDSLELELEKLLN